MFTGFTKINLEAMFEEMDDNKDGEISQYEWDFYFKRVLASGHYSEDDICEEIQMFLDGDGFCKFETAPAAGERRPSITDMKHAN